MAEVRARNSLVQEWNLRGDVSMWQLILCLLNAGVVCGKFEFHDRRERFVVTF